MNFHNALPCKLSRRSFAKLAANSCILAPLAPALIYAREVYAEDLEPGAATDATTIIQKEKDLKEDIPQKKEVKEHIPPITLEEGSLEIECPTFKFMPQSGARPNKYTGGKHKHIIKVEVIQLMEVGGAKIYNPKLKSENVEVRIWLETLDGSIYKPVEPADIPQIVIKGGTDANPVLQIESDQPLINEKPNHPRLDGKAIVRPMKRQHDGYGHGILFRLRKIEVTDADSQVSLEPERYKAHIRIWLKEKP